MYVFTSMYQVCVCIQMTHIPILVVCVRVSLFATTSDAAFVADAADGAAAAGTAATDVAAGCYWCYCYCHCYYCCCRVVIALVCTVHQGLAHKHIMALLWKQNHGSLMHRGLSHK